jgi:RNA 3'-terminal phosphate cyclase (ATP)
MDDIIVLDGSQGEGGGQLIRNAVAYAAILGRSLQIKNIRAGRSKPGLAAQHVTGVRLISQLCGGQLKGDEMGSQALSYTPHPQQQHRQQDTGSNSTTFVGDTKTAGSICLMLQAALPCALFRRTNPCELILKGGTNASMAPQYDYWERVFWPMIQTSFQLPHIQYSVPCRGYFPRGGGQVRLWITPSYTSEERTTIMPPLHLTERGDVCELSIRSHHAGNVPRHVASDMAHAAQTVWHQTFPTIVPTVEIVTEPHAHGSGSGIIVVAKTSTGCRLAGSALGSPKTRANQVGHEATNELLQALQDGGCVDDWLQDQIILYMALAGGVSELVTGSLTRHTQTAVWIAEAMSGAKFQITKLSEGKETLHTTTRAHLYGTNGRIHGKHLIRCQGISYQNN